jgi:hypothetical protein
MHSYFFFYKNIPSGYSPCCQILFRYLAKARPKYATDNTVQEFVVSKIRTAVATLNNKQQKYSI